MIPRAVVDTNTLVQAVPAHGRFHPLFVALRDRRFEIVISNDILMEYQEVLLRQGSRSSWPAIAGILAILQRYGTAILVDPTYRWNALTSDIDDNKFADAAVCGDAPFVVTEDRGFDELIVSTLTNVKPISPRDFMRLVQSSGPLTPDPMP